ncbi:MAG: TRAM domain-containing protein [Planctomycetaceae bacterium]|nr:TRAM domain-containing protein [Planctomycetaceae bacterium]
MFPFSPRKGTPAADFPEQVHPNIRKERCGRLSELERELAMDYYRSQEGSELEVLVERVSAGSPDTVRGTDRRYVPVELPGTIDDVGTFVAARGKASHREYLEASRVT